MGKFRENFAIEIMRKFCEKNNKKLSRKNNAKKIKRFFLAIGWLIMTP